jgi:hypothetical protein
MMKVLALMIVVASVVALAGFPALDAAELARQTLRSVRGDALTPSPVPQATGGLSESGSLLLLATGMSGAAVLLRRRS